MINPEMPPGNNIDAQFMALMSDITIRGVGEHCVVSLASVKDILVREAAEIAMEMSIQAKNMTEEQWPDYLDQANKRLEKVFLNLEEVRYGDEIVASGRSVALALAGYGKNSPIDFMALSDNVRLRGTVEAVYFGEVPAYDFLPKILGEAVMYGDDSTNFRDSSFFGVSFELSNVHIEEDDIAPDSISDDIVVLLPLNYPSLILDRIVREDAS